MIKDAEELLTQWGIWVWEGAGVPGYVSPMRVLMRDNVEQIGRAGSNISDDDAMMIDNMIGALWATDKTSADCLRVYYATGRSHFQVGQMFGISRMQTRDCILKAVAYIQGRLDEKRAA